MRGAGKPPSPESFEEPAWIHVAPSPLSNVLVHCASNTCALFGLQCFPRDSQRSSSGYVTPHQPTTDVLMEDSVEAHLLTDRARRRLPRWIRDAPTCMSSTSSLTPTATRQPNPGKDGAFRFEHARWSRPLLFDCADKLRSMRMPAALQHRAQSALGDCGLHPSQAALPCDLTVGQPRMSFFELWNQTE
jgi:hypothetical protein